MDNKIEDLENRIERLEELCRCYEITIKEIIEQGRFYVSDQYVWVI